MLISEEYKKLNTALHGESAAYGATAHKYTSTIAQIVLASGDTSVLDYGCGKGTLKPALLDLIPGLIPAVVEIDSLLGIPHGAMM